MAVLPYIAVSLLVYALYVSGREVTERAIVSAVALWLALEAVLGIRQLFGMAVSRNVLFQMTGHFGNPGPYGGFIAVCSAIVWAAAWRWKDSARLCDKLISWMAAASGVLGLVVLPATMSRSGWAAFIVAMVFVLFKEGKFRLTPRRRTILNAAAAVLAVAVSSAAFFMKKDSAVGRLHIWKMECLAIADKPLSGHGLGKALGAYGEAQAKFFEAEERSSDRVRIAGCPEYAFNEYLRFGMELGLAGLLLALGIVAAGIFCLSRGCSVLAGGLVAWGVFALASYPLSVWQMCVFLSVLLGAAAGCCVKVGHVERVVTATLALVLSSVTAACWYPYEKSRKAATLKWQDERMLSGFDVTEGVSDSLALLYPYLHSEYRYLYDYGYALHKEGRYDESNKVLMEGAELSSDPIFHDIMGKNFEAEGDYAAAERHYMHAHYMVPSRLYPYILLMEMEDRRGDREKALGYAEQVLGMPVNCRNAAMQSLHERAEKYALMYEKDY